MKKVVIVGGGVAGLSAGIYLSLEGFDCTVLERHSIAGGNLTGWNRSGFHIDNCIHWLTGTLPGTELYRTWETLGALGDGIGLCKTSRFYGSELDGKVLSLSSDIDETREAMLELAPFDRVEIEKFISAVKLASKSMAPGRLSPGDAAAFGLAMLGYGTADLYGISARFRHPLLRRLMTDYIPGEFVGAGLVLAYGAYASGNGGIPLGGSAEMARRIEARFRSLGGRLMTGAEAVRIECAHGLARGVVLQNGGFVPGDYVICAADPAVTFGSLLDRRYMPSGLRRAYAAGQKYPVFSSFHCAFEAENLPADLRHTTVFDIDPVKVGSESISRMVLREYSHDKSFAPRGHILQTMVFQRAPDCEKWIDMYRRDRVGYEILKKETAQRLLERAEARVSPAKGKIHLLDAWTPATYNRYFNSKCGAYMSFAVTRGEKLRRFSPRVKGLENVLLATQWQQMPGGLPTAANAGKLAAKTVTEMARSAKSSTRVAAV